MQEESRENSLKWAIIARMILAGALAVVIKTATGSFICILQIPIDLTTCAQVTRTIWDTVISFQLAPTMMGIISGFTAFILTGKHQLN